MKIAELFVRLTADTSGLKRGMTDAERQMDKFGKTAGRVAGLVGAGLFAGMVKNSIEAQNAIAQLNAVVKSTGGAAGFATPQLQSMATELQRVTTFSDEAVMSAQGLLLTFTKIGGAEFQGATKAVLNVAQAMGTDLKSAAIQVGKALNDPVLGLTSLTRSGIQFSTQQKAVIKQLVATGDVAGAQRVILKELETQFGGSAEAARNTLGGALKALANAFGDTLEVSSDSSKGIVGAINRITESLPMLRRAAENAFTVWGEQVKMFKRDFVIAGGIIVATYTYMAEAAGAFYKLLTFGRWGQHWIDEARRVRAEVVATMKAMQAEINEDFGLRDKKHFGMADIPTAIGGGKIGGRGAGDPAALAEAAKKAWQRLTGPMSDLLALQGAMKEARMNTLSVDNQIFAAYQRINAEIAKGARLTNEQMAAAISLRTELGRAMAPMGGGSITPMAGAKPGFTIKGSTQDDRWGSVSKISPELDTIGSRMREGLADVSNQLISGLSSIATAMMIGGGGKGSQIGGWAGGMLGGAIGGAVMGGKLGSFGGPIGTAVGAIVGTLGGSLFGGLFDKKKKVANGLDMMATQLARVNEQLRNMPSGYKVARGRYGATDVGDNPNFPKPTGDEPPLRTPDGRPIRPPGGGGQPPATIPAQGIYVQNLIIRANNPQDFIREMERSVASVGTRGGPMRLAGAF